MEERSAPTEKITINVTPVDLGQIDALVSQGAYTNRADFIRSAIRHLLQDQRPLVDNLVMHRNFAVGVTVWPRSYLEEAVAAGEKISGRVLGMLVIPNSVTPELASAAIDELTVLGVLRASPAVVKALGPRLHMVGRGR